MNDNRRRLMSAEDEYAYYSTLYLTINVIEDATINFLVYALTSNTFPEYYDESTGRWVRMSSSNNYTFTAGNKIKIKRNAVNWTSGGSDKFLFKSGKVSVEGNIMSMIYGDDFIDKTEIPNTSISTLFTCKDKSVSAALNLVSAENLVLPATTLCNYAYRQMFYNCRGLIYPPKIIAATNFTLYCCSNMFYNCSSLICTPKICAETVGRCTFSDMFNGCTNLLDIFIELPCTTLAILCYNCMFGGCTSITKAPILPAITLVAGCYGLMFDGCTNLNYVKALFTTDISSTTSYTDRWLLDVSSSGTFVKNAAATWSCEGKNGIPSGWTVESVSV